MRLSDGTRLKPKSQVRYLGCYLNDQADSGRELQKRIAESMAVLKKLDLFWRHGDSSIKQKILVYNAVVKSKLLYGLESMQLTAGARNKLDVFHLKGLRKILKMETTFVNKENTNEAVYQRANDAVRSDSPHTVYIPIQKMSTDYDKARLKLFAKLCLAPETDPRVSVTFESGVKPHDYGKKRVGRPRLNWIKETTTLFWNQVVKTKNPSLWLGDLDLDNTTHIQLILGAAEEVVCS